MSEHELPPYCPICAALSCSTSDWSLLYHLIWRLPDASPPLDAAAMDIVARLQRGACLDLGGTVYAIGLMPDHGHLALSIPPTITAADFVAGLFRATAAADVDSGAVAPDNDRFGLCTFSADEHDEIIAYVENQPSHHATNRLRPDLEMTEEPSSI